MNKMWAFFVTIVCVVLALIMMALVATSFHPVAPAVNTDGPAVYEVGE